MVQTLSHAQEKTLEYLRRVVTQSTIDHGVELAQRSAVSELYKDGGKIRGHIKAENEDTPHSACLYVLSPNLIDPSCSCIGHSGNSHNHDWCPHSVALLWAAQDLGIFDHYAGFDQPESLTRSYSSTIQEVAIVIKELAEDELTSSSTSIQAKSDIKIFIKVQNEGLAIKPFINGQVFVQPVFEHPAPFSERALDNILLEKISHDGIWDELNEIWLANGSRSIDTILGLLKEYTEIYWLDSEAKKQKAESKVTFSEDHLTAILEISWLDSTVEVTMHWQMENGDPITSQVELIGTGPYWCKLDKAIYRVSKTASRIAAIFPHSNTLSFPKTKSGPLLELLNDKSLSSQSITVSNKKKMPKAEIANPQPKIDLRLNTGTQGNSPFEIVSVVDFEYPEPPPNAQVVYLANRLKEQEVTESLKQIGFEFDPSLRRFKITGDKALDLVEAGTKVFPSDWQVAGLNEIRKNIKFSQLSLNVSVANSTSTDWSTDDIDWFDCHVSLTQNNANIPLSAIFKNQLSSSDRWIQLDGGAYAKVPGQSLTQLKAVLGTINSSFWMSNTIKTKLSAAQAMSFSSFERDSSVNINASQDFTAILKKVQNFKEIESIPIPKKFKGKLRPYQKQGLYWLNFLNDFSFGGILADEMGLGKTVQTLAFLQHLKDRGSKKPSLIVVPTSIITNWQYEATRFTPDLKVLVLQGPQRRELFKQIPDHDLIVTSYALLRIDSRDLEKHTYNYFILDEAQNIKNEQAATTKAAKGIRSYRRLALTGTPTENRPMELWSILDFLMPGYLGTADFFRKNFEKPILESGPSHKVADFLRSKVRPFILKRRKADVEKDLPPKLESVIHVEMTPAQQALYLDMLSEIRPRVFGEIKEKGVGGASICILAALLRLRQICNHPQSIEAFREFEDLSSGKFNALQELITEALDSNRKILLYSQFVTMLDIIRTWLNKDQVPYLYLDGRTKNRQDLVDRFNSDESVRLFLISLKAGGTGLNLTGADTVIIYDPWWNPAVEDQAADRAHRIGQTKAVTVYRLVTENSVERRIMDLKARKSMMVDSLLNDQGVSPLKLTKTDIESLFAPPEPLT